MRESNVRAIELICIAINDQKKKSGLRELPRYKELMADAHLLKVFSEGIPLSLLRGASITGTCQYVYSYT